MICSRGELGLVEEEHGIYILSEKEGSIPPIGAPIANYLGLNDIGKITEGYKSNFLVLDKNFNLKQVYLNGKKII